MQLIQPLARVPTPGDHETEEPILLSLSLGERELVTLAIVTVRRVIDDVEFQTRLGVLPAEADALLASLLGSEAEPPTAAPRPISAAEEMGETVIA